MIWQPLLHPSAVVLGVFAVVVLCAVVVTMMRRVGWPMRIMLIALRTVALAAIGVVLLSPMAMRSDAPTPTPPTLHVMVDASPSMGVDDPPRIARVNDWLSGKPLADMEADVRWWAFDAAARSIDPPPITINTSSNATRLFASLEHMTQSASPGDVVLLISDGHDTTGDAPTALVPPGVRVFALPVAGDERRRAILVASPSRAFTDEPIELRLMTAGFDHDAPVTIHRDDESIFTHTVRDSNRIMDTPFNTTAQPGDVATYRAVVGKSDEAQAAAAATVEHLGQRVRVLMVEGQPNWNSRFVADALRGDAHVDLTVVQSISPQRSSVIRYAPSVRDDAEPASVDAPITREDLRPFDVIITGRSLERCMSEDAIAALASHVAGDNGLVMLGEPVTEFTTAPPAVADASISIDYGRIGAGRVASIGDASVWRTLFAEADAKRQAAAATLRSVVRWAAVGDPRPRKIESDPPGPGDELTDTTPRPDVLEQLTRSTGGEVVTMNDLQPLRDALAAADQPAPADDDLIPAWPRGWVFALIVVPLIAEWFLRRTGGLP